uniref:Protein T28C6.5 n=2 Tax=Haemonchus contortus TaxID=6289 RepID=A0A7I4Y7N5_HAECO
MSSGRREELVSSHYLPRFARKSRQARVRQIGYSVDKDPVTSMITFHYNVVWTDSDDSLARRYELLKTSLRKVSKLRRSEREVVLPRLIQCNGACGTWAPEDYIVQFGLCDHNICFRCYESEASISLTNDGSRGCCNKECVERARAELAMKTPPMEDRAYAGAVGGGGYTMFPGSKKLSVGRKEKLNTEDRRRQKFDMKSWNEKLAGSDVSFFGDYDDVQLQKMAETMRSAAEQQDRQIVDCVPT